MQCVKPIKTDNQAPKTRFKPAILMLFPATTVPCIPQTVEPDINSNSYVSSCEKKLSNFLWNLI